MNKLPKKSIETLRTTPIGVALSLVSTVALAGKAFELYTTRESKNAATIPLYMAGLALGGVLIKEQLGHRKKLETALVEGDADNLFPRSTKAWCTRQNAIGAARNAGILDEYEEMYESNPDRKFKWLPHF
ncbi:MAG TPA: hypothetical protein VK497_00350 [Candidatus Saccharimonadales bacterium]|nr:hypothetical protein [Candidatus Saccharimonadales bacterium]